MIDQGETGDDPVPDPPEEEQPMSRYPARFLRTTEARFAALAGWDLDSILGNGRVPASFWAADRERLFALVHTTTKIRPDVRVSLIVCDDMRRYRPALHSEKFPSVRAAEDAMSGAFGEVTLKMDISVEPDGRGPGADLFAPVADTAKLSGAFRYLRDGNNQSAARELLAELGHWVFDRDGNLVKDFQTTGYSARVWEIYLNFAFRELGLAINEGHQAPDFELETAGSRIFVEATTVNAPGGGVTNLHAGSPPMPPSDLWQYLEEEMPLRFGSPMHTKMQKKYWELDHVKGHPFVLAIADFHDSASMTWSHTAMPIYLYGRSAAVIDGVEGTRSAIEKRLAGFARKGELLRPFFEQEGAEHVSAVLFSNAGTISKFNRMGVRAGFGDRFVALRRMGIRNNPAPGSLDPIEFSDDVESLGYDEQWADELLMFHNPRAIHPVDEDGFPGIAHYFQEGDDIIWRGAPFRVLSSTTATFDMLGRDADLAKFNGEGDTP